MRTINLTICPGPRFLRAFLVSGVLLLAVVWRMLNHGEDLLSARVGLACCFISMAFLVVWGTQRATGQRWSWFVVLLAVCGAAIALVWLAVAIERVVRTASQGP